VSSSPYSLEESFPHQPDLAGLIRKVAAGDQQAFSALYSTTGKLVFGLVLRILGDPSVAEEVLFDVFTQVWRQAGRYDLNRGAPLGWLTTIARSRAIDRLRSEKQYQQNDELTEAAGQGRPAAGDPETNTAISEMQRFVRGALNSLTVEQREVIELSYYSGMTQSEVASHLGLPLGTVKTRTRLGMIKLREVLKPVLETLL
jgi:RNA polymerase sigma-70 factor (ECF subfamily)